MLIVILFSIYIILFLIKDIKFLMFAKKKTLALRKTFNLGVIYSIIKTEKVKKMSTRPTDANSIKRGSYIVVDEEPCVVLDLSHSKTGKHGHAKCRIEAIGLVDGKKIIKVVPGHDNVEVPIIEKKTAQVLSVHGDTANVMDMESYETFDIKVPSEVKDQIVEGAQVLYWIILNDKVIKQVK